MTVSSVTSHVCDLCSEVLSGGATATAPYIDPTRKEPYSRLILRTPVVDVMVGLGCIVPGYVLLMPRRHVRSMGELTVPEITHVFDVAWRMRDRISEVFGKNVVLVEHGSSGHLGSPSGACIDHAHIHLFPVRQGIDFDRFLIPGIRPTHGITELNVIAQLEKNYYYCAFDRFVGYVSIEPQLKSQQARRVWAEALGMQMNGTGQCSLF